MSLEEVRDRIDTARSIAVLTGAGISAESGVPTFRGEGGLWRDRKPEELATAEAFAENPRLVWEWYDWRRGLIAGAKPNLAHFALVTLEKRSAGLTLVTQNVDGLHALAGSRNLLEIHGSIWRTRCGSCREVREDRRVPMPSIPPRCPCEGLLRPDVVWFGESMPFETTSKAFQAADDCDLMLVVGTSGLVQPAASMAFRALERGAAVVEVNADPTPLTPHATFAFQGKAGEVLPRMLS